MSETEKAKNFCMVAHHGQFRRDGVTPYHTHPFAVAERVPEHLKPAAYLHDVLEDTVFTIDDLLASFPASTCAIVACLTRRKDETYNAYISRVLENVDAVQIKIADMEHNLACQPSENSVRKIAMWLPILKERLNANPTDEETKG